MDTVELQHKRNYNPDNYKLYFMETGLLVASLDDEALEDLMLSRNIGHKAFKVYFISPCFLFLPKMASLFKKIDIN